MAETLLLVSVTLIFILILIQKISLRFLFKEKLRTEIDYSFFTLILTENEEKKASPKISPKLFPKIKRVMEYLLRHSELIISEIKIKSQKTEPKSFILGSKNLFSLFAALTVYLSKKTKKLSLNDSSFEVFNAENENSRHSFDLSIRTPLYIALITAAMFLLVKLKNKKLIKAKRGQNV